MTPTEEPAAVRARGLRCLAAALVAAAAALARGLVTGTAGTVAESAMVIAFVVLAAVDWRRLRRLEIGAAAPTQRACLAGQVGCVVLFAVVGSVGDPALVGVVGFWVPAAVLVGSPAAATGWWTLRQVAAGPTATDG